MTGSTSVTVIFSNAMVIGSIMEKMEVPLQKNCKGSPCFSHPISNTKAALKVDIKLWSSRCRIVEWMLCVIPSALVRKEGVMQKAKVG